MNVQLNARVFYGEDVCEFVTLVNLAVPIAKEDAADAVEMALLCAPPVSEWERE